MSVSNVFGGFEVVFDTTELGGITAYDLGTGIQVANETTSGAIYPEYPTLNGMQPRGNFTTLQVARALDQSALVGASIADLTAGLIFYLRKLAEGSTRTSGATHNKYVINEGLIVPRTLSCQHGEDAQITYEVIVTYDGSNLPILKTESQALPDGQADDQRFTLGAITLGGVSITHVQSFSLDFGITVKTLGADGDIYDTYAWIQEIKPVLTLSGINPDWLKSTGAVALTGLSAPYATTTIYLRKRDKLGSFVADATEEHIKFAMSGLATIDNAIQVSRQGESGCSLTMPLYHDGTNLPFVLDTTSAIT